MSDFISLIKALILSALLVFLEVSKRPFNTSVTHIYNLISLIKAN